MEPQPKPSQSQTSLFQVYLRLRPPITQQAKAQNLTDGYLTVESPDDSGTSHDDNGADGTWKWPTHITVRPPNESRKRAMERFAFTKVFEEEATQLDIFEETGMVSIMNGVLGEGRDGLVATLGVTGSGKSHTILGSKSQRGITQMSLDVLFRSLGTTIRSAEDMANPLCLDTFAASDSSDAHIFSARAFLEGIYGDPSAERNRISRSQTPMSSSTRSQTPMVWNASPSFISPGNTDNSHPTSSSAYPAISALQGAIVPSDTGSSPPVIRLLRGIQSNANYRPLWSSPNLPLLPSQLPFWNSHKTTKNIAKSQSRLKESFSTSTSRRPQPPRPSTLAHLPDTSDYAIPVHPGDEHVVLVSMYEVYNDRIFDLLSPSNGATSTRPSNNQKGRRRPLLFKPTEGSTDRKAVAGLRKIVCSTYEDALMILETGLVERKVTGTGSNSASSRSHGFFSVEVKKKVENRRSPIESWVGNTLTIVDLAGSERARNAKTAGATLAEAGKINESLMYLGQCLQMQTNVQDGNKALVPFRQCKLTELLFSNSFPSSNHSSNSQPRKRQKAIMIVTADPLGDFNATSQILRYSALAREVTVPRIPSVSNTTAPNVPASENKCLPNNTKSMVPSISAEELETAALEIAHISDEYSALAIRLADEEVARAEAEVKWRAAEEKCLFIEQSVREECWEEMEQRVKDEKARWQVAWDEQANRHDEHLDQKLDLLSRGIKIYEDPEPDTAMDELQHENDILRYKISQLERQLQSRSPTKTRPKTNTIPGRFNSSNCRLGNDDSDIENALSGKLGGLQLENGLSPSPVGSPNSLRRPRVLNSRPWNGPNNVFED